MSNWCPEIYRSMFVDMFNDDKIRVAPCCQATSVVEPIESFDFKTSPHLTNLREQFNNGLKPAACNCCWQVEKLGHKSRRQSAIEFFNLPEPTTEIVLEGLDHSATWACNMACIMCGPDASSLWAKEKSYTSNDLTLIGRKFQKENNILSNLDLSNIKKIHFNGGEPFLNLRQLDLLEKLDEQDVLKTVFISYNTNGSVFPDSRIINYWKRSRLVKLFFSIDAVGPAFEYIRWPGKWQQVNENIKQMKDSLPSNVMFGLSVTVGNYNVLEMKDLCDWFDATISTNREGDASDFNWQIANNFDPGNCSDTIKTKVVEDLTNISRMQGLVNYIKTSGSYNISDSWIDTFDEYDLKRNTNWHDCLKIGKYY